MSLRPCSVRAAIDPAADPQYQQHADNLPASALRPAFYSTLTARE